MSHVRLWIPIVFAVLLSACSSNDPDPAQYGPDPVLPKPERGLLADMTVARPAPWGDQVPTVPEGYTVSAIATDLKIPRQTTVLPNGDILVAEGRGGLRAGVKTQRRDRRLYQIQRNHIR